MLRHFMCSTLVVAFGFHTPVVSYYPDLHFSKVNMSLFWICAYRKVVDLLRRQGTTVFCFYTCPDKYILGTCCFAYSIHLSYWPPFFGGCVSCPQVQPIRVEGHQLKTPVSSWRAPLLRSHFCYNCNFWVLCILFTQGYDGGPVQSFTSVRSFRGLWTSCEYGSR